VADEPRNIGHSARDIGRRVRHARRHGHRTSRVGVVLIIAGGALLVVAVVGAVLVNL
jgi:hypothetical protein